MTCPGPSRRDLFRALFGQRRQEPAPPVSYVEAPAPRFGRGKPLPVVRPPGAIEESAFLAVCTRCNQCLDACPHEAIVPAPPRLRAVAGSPVLNLPEAPCRMCADFPCITACEPGALRVDVPVRMGTAVIAPLNCLAHQNSPCSVCVEHCPVPGALRLENGRPQVDATACTGCGVCQHVCPAPQHAVIVLPARDRPQPMIQEGAHAGLASHRAG